MRASISPLESDLISPPATAPPSMHEHCAAGRRTCARPRSRVGRRDKTMAAHESHIVPGQDSGEIPRLIHVADEEIRLAKVGGDVLDGDLVAYEAARVMTGRQTPYRSRCRTAGSPRHEHARRPPPPAGFDRSPMDEAFKVQCPSVSSDRTALNIAFHDIGWGDQVGGRVSAT